MKRKTKDLIELRDEFALHAMTALISKAEATTVKVRISEVHKKHLIIALGAYAYADAMLYARKFVTRNAAAAHVKTITVKEKP